MFCLIVVAILVNSWISYPKYTAEPATFTVEIAKITDTANEANSTPETISISFNAIPHEVIDEHKSPPECSVLEDGTPSSLLYMSPTTSSFFMEYTIGRDLYVGEVSPAIRSFEAALCSVTSWGHNGVVQDGQLNQKEAGHAGNLNLACFGEYKPFLTRDLLLALDGFYLCPTGQGIKANIVHMNINLDVPPEVNKATIWWVTKWLTSEYRANQMVMLAKAESNYRNKALGSSCDTGVLQLVEHQGIALDLGYYWPDDNSECGDGQHHDMYDAAYNTVVAVHLATGRKIFTSPWTTAALFGFKD